MPRINTDFRSGLVVCNFAMFRMREDRDKSVKYTHPSTAAVAHVTVATDSYDSESPRSPRRYGRRSGHRPLPAGTRGFSSTIEYAGDGSPQRSSLRNSLLSSSDEVSRSRSSTPRVTFGGAKNSDSAARRSGVRQTLAEAGLTSSGTDAFGPRTSTAEPRKSSSSATSRKSVSAADEADDGRRKSVNPNTSDDGPRKSVSAADDGRRKSVNPDTSDHGPRKSVSAAGDGQRKSVNPNTSEDGRRTSVNEADDGRRKSVNPDTSEDGRRKSASAADDSAQASTAANTSTNNPQLNVNRNATQPRATKNVLVRLYRKLFWNRRQSRNDAEAGTPANDNANVSNLADERYQPSAGIPPSAAARNVTPATRSSRGRRAVARSSFWNNDQFVDDDDDDEDWSDDDADDKTTTTESDDDDTNNEYTRLLRQRKQPLPDLSKLCRTSFNARTPGGDLWSRRPRGQRKSLARRRYDLLEQQSID